MNSRITNSRDMDKNRLYIEEEGIVFESYVEEPDSVEMLLDEAESDLLYYEVSELALDWESSDENEGSSESTSDSESTPDSEPAPDSEPSPKSESSPDSESEQCADEQPAYGESLYDIEDEQISAWDAVLEDDQPVAVKSLLEDDQPAVVKALLEDEKPSARELLYSDEDGMPLLPAKKLCRITRKIERRVSPSSIPPSVRNLLLVDVGRLREAGVPEYVIEMICRNQEDPSPLKITRNGKIVLPDYKIEIKMTPLDKALYFLFLRHPEGIRFKELCDYREELVDLYASVSIRDDTALITQSVDALIDPMSNSVNEKCSRIKRAFTKVFGDEIARYYYIDGKSGEPKSIALDRKFVTWETIRP